MIANASPLSGGFSWPLMLTLSAMLGVSALMFWLLVRRATDHRQWLALAQWGRERGMRLQRVPAPAPAPLDAIGGLAVAMSLRGPDRAVLRLRHDLATTGGHRFINLLIHPLQTDWPPTALRPAADVSVVDLFELSEFSTLSGERFTVMGSDAPAARALARSSAKALLPADIGLLLHGRQMMLDFSARPFDEIEFDRMNALAEQLAAHLPAIA